MIDHKSGEGWELFIGDCRTSMTACMADASVDSVVCDPPYELGGTVFDPFVGSGSTGRAALQEGFKFIGCELLPEHAAIAVARISNAEAK